MCFGVSALGQIGLFGVVTKSTKVIDPGIFFAGLAYNLFWGIFPSYFEMIFYIRHGTVK